MMDSRIPNLGERVRVINPARASYGLDGYVVRVNNYGKYRDVEVSIAGNRYIYELNEIERIK